MGPGEDLGAIQRGGGWGPSRGDREESLGGDQRGGIARLRDGPDTHVTQLRSPRCTGGTPEMEPGDALVECPRQGQSAQHNAASGDPWWLRRRKR